MGTSTMVARSIILAAPASVPRARVATAEGCLDLTPPLCREQARPTAAVRPASKLGTAPRLSPTAPAEPRIVAGTSVHWCSRPNTVSGFVELPCEA